MGATNECGGWNSTAQGTQYGTIVPYTNEKIIFLDISVGARISHYNTMGSRRANLSTRDKFREHLKVARQNAGLTQAELAVRAGISGVTLSKLETGVNGPTLDILLALCDALRATPNDLIGWAGSEPSENEPDLKARLSLAISGLPEEWLEILISIAEKVGPQPRN